MSNEERIIRLEAQGFDREKRLSIAETNIDVIKRQLTKIDENTTWLIRIILGFMILAILGFLFTQGPAIKSVAGIIGGLIHG